MVDLDYFVIETTNHKHHNYKAYIKRAKKEGIAYSTVAFSDTHI
jgi:hypothetical protein